jgi:hypothetical protein
MTTGLKKISVIDRPNGEECLVCEALKALIQRESAKRLA